MYPLNLPNLQDPLVLTDLVLFQVFLFIFLLNKTAEDRPTYSETMNAAMSNPTPTYNPPTSRATEPKAEEPKRKLTNEGSQRFMYPVKKLMS